MNDPPENIWFEVKFLQPYKVPIDAPAVASIDSEVFDSEGRAVVDRLRSAEPGAEPATSDFEKDQTGIFDKATADKLIAGGIAEKVRPIFRRRLIDFELKFHAVNTQIVELNGRIRALSLDVASIQASKTKADRQATLLEDYKTKLNDDLTKVKFELEELTSYGDSVAGRLGEVRAELSNLYRSNKALSRELAALNAQMTEEIERRTREATARRELAALALELQIHAHRFGPLFHAGLEVGERLLGPAACGRSRTSRAPRRAGSLCCRPSRRLDRRTRTPRGRRHLSPNRSVSFRLATRGCSWATGEPGQRQRGERAQERAKPGAAIHDRASAACDIPSIVRAVANGACRDKINPWGRLPACQ